MSKKLGYEKIGYEAATFKVSPTAIAALKKDHTNPRTGNIDVNDKKLAVKMNNDNTVGFGASTATAADALLGILIAYEDDGYASVQIRGGVEDVATKAAIKSGRQSLGVNDKGQIEVVSDGKARNTLVAVGSEEENLLATIIL